MVDILQILKLFLIGPYPNGEIGGLFINLFLAVTSLGTGFVFGLFLALGRTGSNRIIAFICASIIDITRATPLLLIIFWFYFFIPSLLGQSVSLIFSAYISLSLYSTVNQAEIFRGGLLSISRGQYHAAFSTGLNSTQTMIFVILPQILRMMLSSFVSFFMSLIKDTSVIYIIGIVDLTQIGVMFSQRQPAKLLLSYLIVGILYFIVCSILSKVAKRYEKITFGKVMIKSKEI
jgi:polar amino acid transport system permease protein